VKWADEWPLESGTGYYIWRKVRVPAGCGPVVADGVADGARLLRLSIEQGYSEMAHLIATDLFTGPVQSAPSRKATLCHRLH
jgi:hypothetical protein